MVTPLPPEGEPPDPPRGSFESTRAKPVVALLIIIVAAGAAGWWLRGGDEIEPTRVPVGPISEFPVGTITERVLDVGHFVPFGDEAPGPDVPGENAVAETRLFVVNHPEAGILALSQRSPFRGCRVVEVRAAEASGFGHTVSPGFERGFLDPCHGGLWNLDGTHAAGAGERGLVRFPVRFLSDGSVAVDLTRPAHAVPLTVER